MIDNRQERTKSDQRKHLLFARRFREQDRTGQEKNLVIVYRIRAKVGQHQRGSVVDRKQRRHQQHAGRDSDKAQRIKIFPVRAATRIE